MIQSPIILASMDPTPQLLGLTPQLLGLTTQYIDSIREKYDTNILNS
jgi:hypothetical protein